MIRIIGLIIGVILLISGIILGVAGISTVLQELKTINETVAAGIYVILFGLIIWAIGSGIIKSIIIKK